MQDGQTHQMGLSEVSDEQRISADGARTHGIGLVE